MGLFTMVFWEAAAAHSANRSIAELKSSISSSLWHGESISIPRSSPSEFLPQEKIKLKLKTLFFKLKKVNITTGHF